MSTYPTDPADQLAQQAESRAAAEEVRNAVVASLVIELERSPVVQKFIGTDPEALTNVSSTLLRALEAEVVNMRIRSQEVAEEERIAEEFAAQQDQRSVADLRREGDRLAADGIREDGSLNIDPATSEADVQPVVPPPADPVTEHEGEVIEPQD